MTCLLVLGLFLVTLCLTGDVVMAPLYVRWRSHILKILFILLLHVGNLLSLRRYSFARNVN